MGTITTLRPSATSSGVGWTATPSGTLHGVTSDNSDATYALWSGDGSALILATPLDSPPAGERRHQVRLRARGEDGDAWWAVRLSSGVLVSGAAAQFPSSPSTITGSWGFGAPATGSTQLYAYVTGQSSGVKIEELYLDVDTREAPTFTPQVLDGSGSSSVFISDTASPVIHVDSLDLDGLAARQYRFRVTRDGASIWDTGVVSGPPIDQPTPLLENGTYVAHIQVFSTLGADTAYASAEETVTFVISVGTVPKPVNPTVTPRPDAPFYDLEACAPYVGDLDGAEGYVEIQRVDCPIGGYLNVPGSGYSLSNVSVSPSGLFVTVSSQRSDFWFPPELQALASQYEELADDRSWKFALRPDGYLSLEWTTDGTDGTLESAVSTLPPPVDPYGRAWTRVWLDVDDGAGGWAVTFYASTDEGLTWDQLGDVVDNGGGGTTSVHSPTPALFVGATSGGLEVTDEWQGRIYSVEFREEPGGTVLASPDFTGHRSGTTEFTDAQGNLWYVIDPASLVGTTSTTTLTVLGPLATDECATWTDYTLPRAGVGRTCDHEPVSCCSYYRARTVGRIDGSLVISDWSDSYDPGIPSGLIVMWPSTDASVPAGWSRVTDLDGIYPKGVATSATQPGSTGGAASHSHTVSGHSHDTSHVHTMSGNTSSAVGSVNSHDGAAGTSAIASSHTHTVPASTIPATVSSGSTTPFTGTGGNDPARLEVIFMESNGTPEGVPDGAISAMGDVAPAGWDTYADATDRFLRGATAAGDGGGTAASAVGSHTHSIAAHTHTGTSHTHISLSTGSVSSNLTLFAGPNNVTWASSHSHSIVIGSQTSSSLTSGGSGSSGASGSIEPPYTNVRVRQNNSGAPDLPVGLICAWRGSLGSIPEHWALCDGTGGTPDLVARYPRGATSSIGGTGGTSDPHSHTSPDHSHSTTGHSHSMTIAGNSGNTTNTSATSTVSVATGTHSHTHGATASETPLVADSTSGTLANTTTDPLHEEVAFVQLVEEPTPPADPDTFCLSWSDDEHLIRSMSPDGPVWAPVIGMFDWDRDRPFTAATGVNGTRFVTSSPPGGRNMSMVAAVKSESELAQLRAVLSRPLVLISPSDSSEVWAAPVTESVRVIKIGRIRQVTADFIGTGPQPEPQLSDIG
jgi:hypothetical protein